MLLLDLPFEVLLQIAGELPASDLVAVAGTSKTLNLVSRDQKLWHKLLGSHSVFRKGRDYREAYAWQHGNLAVDVKDSKEEGVYPVLAFFPMHRSYEASKLAELSPQFLPWATDLLRDTKEDLLILSCQGDRLISHVYKDTAADGAQHALLLLQAGQRLSWLTDLPDWPLCAAFLGRYHILVCGRFPAALLYDLRRPGSARGIPLSSHTIHCLSIDTDNQDILLCGHYKGRGSMEVLSYEIDETGNLSIAVSGQNKFAGVTAIVSCAYLSSGAFMTYDNYSHIYLWSSLRNALRKIDHDGIGDEIPSDMVYKMFYSAGSLVFIDQYKHKHAFTIRPGRQIAHPRTDEEGGIAGSDQGQVAAAAAAAADEQIRQLLFKQDNDMASLTRRVLGI
ncbi:protein of unknown function [Taphrina deformans PYCC 5710]|uniref:F-box domain-containing protein n=1 Tax=Taphrina deformans (strain PYCC 5710 / ATCC 11124 / CBS 356.35 / IMI 108563 / JCM 9778 / NBRC 8474) TaxID=1097556 RepID=R4XH88_TAPDE|nr:protein of unknown function [Taphrina deformans PYCC 5710]|eukprot:CCG82761.1 protein of unknown function [Taphrina deformans PYCC 5710]